MKTPVEITVNKKKYKVEVDTRMILADMLREELRLTGTHIGCGTGNCGACTVIMNGETVKSCCIIAADANGQEVLTIEGISSSANELHPIQQAFVENQGLQCGYCTPGMVLSTIQLLKDNPDPSEDQIRHGISGNLCRCTGYQFIVQSIQDAAKRLSKNGKAPASR
ncbi:MAG: (2Fe-2S)-binding protein [Candidatus Binatus sp.]|uniref:(2Fe-2S)-binding protein n=1 Tax=Candidatus Binatus sp. TaxID=2811406 RepID=UPI003BB0ED8C